MAKTVVGLFDQAESARAVVQSLVDHGIAQENISYISNDLEGRNAADMDQEVDKENTAKTGAGLGAIIGGVAGLLVGMGTFLVPGIGPILAAGPIIAALGGAGVGAVAGGLVGALTRVGISENDASIFSEGVKRGGFLVVAYVPDDKADEVTELMNRYHPVDIEERSQSWQNQNWAADEPNPEPFAFDRTTSTPETRSLPADQERFRRVRAYPAAVENDRTDKQRQGLLDIDAIDIEDWKMYESRFRDHYKNRYANLGSWEDFRESYRYGYRLGGYGPFMNTEWGLISGEIRRDWEERHSDLDWFVHEEAVSQGWEVRRTRQ